jgi:hypothetical protein
MIRWKEQDRIMRKCLEERGLRKEEQYIETQNDTREGASENNRKEFRETNAKERRAIHSETV